MARRKMLCRAAGLILLLAVFFLTYRLSHPTRWSKDLLVYLDQAETITGEAVWKNDNRALSEEQVKHVLEVIKSAKIGDNRGFAGTTPSGFLFLDVDGEKVFVSCVEDTELQYHWNGEKRSVRMEREGYAPVLQEIMREAFQQ